MRLRATLTALVVLLAACDKANSDSQPAPFGNRVNTDSMGIDASRITPVELRDNAKLSEASGAAASVRHPGVIYSINDSNNEPLLFAVDTLGMNRGIWRVTGATNVDWEAVAMGPCPHDRDCIYIGDTGDNNARLRSRTIYRMPEPGTLGVRDTIHAESLTYVYADGPRDVEAMYVTPFGDVILITKRRSRGRHGQLRPALVYALPASAWSQGARATATLVDSLPIVPGSAALDVITDASLAPDRRHLVVRTYVQAYVFATDPA
ncbi:MAG: hypothetical protein ACREBE_17895, partial [bacterium]